MTAFFLVALIALATALDVTAGGDLIPSYYHGFPYPIDGLEHVVAMIAVGIVAVRYGGAARWVLPAVFTLMLSIGISLGMATRWFSTSETDVVVAISVCVTGFLALSGMRPALWMLVPVLGALAIFHGYAHGLRVPTSSNAVRYSREIVVATAIMLVAGMALGSAYQHVANRRKVVVKGGEAAA